MTSEPLSNTTVEIPNQPSDQTGLKPPQSFPSEMDDVFKKKRSVVNRVVLFVLMATALLVIVPMLKVFFVPLLLACTVTSLFFPLYTMLLKLFRGNRSGAALLCCAVLILAFVVPLYFIGYLVTHQILSTYQAIEPTVQAFLREPNTEIFAQFKTVPIFSWLVDLNINWQNTALDALKNVGAFTAKMANKTSMGALEAILGLFITLFMVFYLFMDGTVIVKKFRQLLPLHTEYQDMIITRFLMVSRASVKGTLLIALVQGSLGALILLIFGVKSWLLWGVVMIAFALIPMMGAWLVLIPAGIIQIATGQVWQGVVILALSFGVVSTIDNVLRPRLVGRGARMHDLLIFLSTLGGLAMFGPIGVITGPVIMAFFVSILEIYTMELKTHLGESSSTR